MALQVSRARLRIVPQCLLYAGGMALYASGAFAQGAPMSFGRSGPPPSFTNQALDQSLEDAKRRPPPAALPGAQSHQALAPAHQVPTLMSPNEALFDAIDRGDMPAARDALNRGAELDGRNVLGMTPLELSIDLGRNDISFLLLSMRNADAGPKGPPQAQAAAVAPAGAAKAGALARLRPARNGPSVAPVSATSMSGIDPEAPRRFSDGGGTPVPQAGFLGFDAGRR